MIFHRFCRLLYYQLFSGSTLTDVDYTIAKDFDMLHDRYEFARLLGYDVVKMVFSADATIL